MECIAFVMIGKRADGQTEPSHSWFPPRKDNWSSIASSGGANDWRNREHAVFDRFSQGFGEPLWGK